MSLEIEAELVEWIILEDRAGNAPGLARLCCITEEMLVAAGKTGSDLILGKKWHQNFIKYYNQIRAIFIYKVESV